MSRLELQVFGLVVAIPLSSSVPALQVSDFAKWTIVERTKTDHQMICIGSERL